MKDGRQSTSAVLDVEERRPTRSPVPNAVADDSLVALVTGIRWAVSGGGILWAIALGLPASNLLAGITLVAYALFRTFRPLEYSGNGWRSLWAIITELAMCLGAVVTTEGWESPYIFCLFTPVIAAGLAQGYWHAFRVALTAVATVAAAAWLLEQPSDMRIVVTWVGELVLVAVVASYGRRLLDRAEAANTMRATQLWRLNEANALLMSLNRLSRDMPVSFDFQDTMHDALTQVNNVTRPDVSALLLLDPISLRWNVTLAEGARLADGYPDGGLPKGLITASRSQDPLHVDDLSEENPGLASTSRAGLYIPLVAGPRHIGLIAVESQDANRFADVRLAEMRQLAHPLALAVDNARWFDRLRAGGAAQERTRIARDLHDRVGQGVAYLAFELDRLAELAKDDDLAEDLAGLRADARSIVKELRETLYDLRTDVSDDRGIDEIIGEFLQRVESRSDISTSFEHDARARITLSQEREVWRIAQEAILNAERHAKAQHISVRWILENDTAELTVTDDGIGITSNGVADGYGQSATPGRPAYGITGMRERAESIGALLKVSNAKPAGTVVKLIVSSRPSSLTGAARVPGGQHDQ